MVSKLTMESLEDRRCLSSDMELSEPTNHFQSEAPSTPVLASTKELAQTETRDEAPIDPLDSIDPISGEVCRRSDFVDHFMSEIERCDSLDPVENLDEVSEEGSDASDPMHESDQSQSAKIIDVTSTVFGFAEIGMSTAQETEVATDINASAFAGKEHGQREATKAHFENPVAPPIQPALPKMESRPAIQPVEALQIQTANWTPRSDNFHSTFDTRSVNPWLAIETNESQAAAVSLHSALETEFFVVSTRNTTESPEPVRPNIASVVALMPAWQTKSDEAKLGSQRSEEIPVASNSKRTETELSAVGLLVKLVNPPDFEFPLKNEEKEESGSGKTDKALNPLCFVVLVGLVGLPQSWRNRLLRTVVMRDTRKTSRPITVVPQEKQLKPWRETTFVNRKHDETI